MEIRKYGLNLGESYQEQGAQASVQKIDLTPTIGITGEVNTQEVGTYPITYTVYYNKKEVSVTRMVYVLDTIAPVITLKGKEEVTIPLGSTYQDPGCIAQDNQDGELTNLVTITGIVDTKSQGEYTITYEVKDKAGNITRKTRKVIVSEKSTIPTSSTATKQSNQAQVRGLPVLMYHFFYDEAKGEKGKDNNWMEIGDFEAQMKYLSENSFYFPSWNEVEEFIDKKDTLPSNSVVITVDDGDETFLRLAIPIIQKYNVKVTSFLVTSWNGDWVVPQYQYNKLDFQSHSHDMHKAGKDGKGAFLTLSHQKALDDVLLSKKVIGNATIFCYPFGHYNESTKSILKEAGYQLAFTTKSGRVYPGSDKFALPRIRMSKGETLSSFKAKVK